MNGKKHLVLLSILILIGVARGAELDVQEIATLIDAYEKQVDSIKLEYIYKFPSGKQGVYEITKGVFAQKRSEGFILLDERKQIGEVWDDDLESTGNARSYNGRRTKYLEHETNDHGYHMAALYENHNQKLYKTGVNPFSRFYRVNYATKLADLLYSPDTSVKVLGKEEVGGVAALKISIEKAGSDSKRFLWLLPEKNYLPIRYRLPITVEGKEIYWQIDWSDFRESDSGIWFPWRIQTNFSDVAEPAVIEVQEVDFTPLTREDFDFDFPPLTHVTDHLLGIKYLITPTTLPEAVDALLAESSVNNDQKEAILDRYVEKGKAIPSSENTVPFSEKNVDNMSLEPLSPMPSAADGPAPERRRAPKSTPGTTAIEPSGRLWYLLSPWIAWPVLAVSVAIGLVVLIRMKKRRVG